MTFVVVMITNICTQLAQETAMIAIPPVLLALGQELLHALHVLQDVTLLVLHVLFVMIIVLHVQDLPLPAPLAIQECI